MTSVVEPESGAQAGAETDTEAHVMLDTAEPGEALEMLIKRARRMFLDMSRSPRASGLKRSATEATLRVICLVDQARAKLWAESEADVRAACCPRLPDGLFCKQELLGYLLADVLGRPLLPAEDALSVGQCGDNAVAKAKRVEGTFIKNMPRHQII